MTLCSVLSCHAVAPQMDTKGINWATVRYMICEVHYGGRITDDYDRLLMKTYGNLWLSDAIFSDRWSFGYPGQVSRRFRPSEKRCPHLILGGNVFYQGADN